MWCDMEQLKAAKMQMMPVSMYTQPTYGSWNPYGGAQTAMLIPGPPANMQGCSCARKTSCDCKKRKKKKKKKKSKSDSDDESVHYYMRRSEPRYDGCEWSSIFIRSFAGSDSEKNGGGAGVVTVLALLSAVVVQLVVVLLIWAVTLFCSVALCSQKRPV